MGVNDNVKPRFYPEPLADQENSSMACDFVLNPSKRQIGFLTESLFRLRNLMFPELLPGSIMGSDENWVVLKRRGTKEDSTIAFR